MKRFKNFLLGEKRIIISFGRMNPITHGHQKVLEKVKSLADELCVPHEVILTNTQDSEKNPLSVEEKLQYAKKLFPMLHFVGSKEGSTDISYHLNRLRNEGFTKFTLVVGADRKPAFESLGIDIVTVDRGPDDISASALRDAARNGNFESFRNGLPSHIEDSDAESLYSLTRRGLNLSK